MPRDAWTLAVSLVMIAGLILGVLVAVDRLSRRRGLGRHFESLPTVTPEMRYETDEAISRGMARLNKRLALGRYLEARATERLIRARAALANAEAAFDTGYLDPDTAADFAELVQIYRSPTVAGDADRPRSEP